VIDCGYTPAAARELRAQAEQVERVVITHGDLDHYGGAQVFADVPIVATAATAETIEESGQARVDELRGEIDGYLADLETNDAPEWEREQGRAIAAELPGMRITPPTETFAGELDLGRAVVLAPGEAHSASDSVVWLPAERVLFAADLVGVDGHLNVTRGDPENWLASLDRLAALEPRTVVPGHGPPAGPEAIAVCREYIETLLALAAEPGDHAMPARYEGWTYPEGYEQNIAALRAR
jgi:glyoxylase-like metal-dependent hydrolase (beta-lactamase superfamily II)